MKKHLLLGLGLGFGIIAIAQNHSTNLVKPSLSTKSYPFVKGKEITGNENVSVKRKSANLKKAAHSMSRSMNGTIIGQTWYDLQTNAAVARRIVNHGDGTISAVWTIAASAGPSYADRGTGYQYFDGTAWFPQVTSRLENIRTGWPSIGLLASGKEVILSTLQKDLRHGRLALVVQLPQFHHLLKALFGVEWQLGLVIAQSILFQIARIHLL
jgi:hypothetical protein